MNEMSQKKRKRNDSAPPSSRKNTQTQLSAERKFFDQIREVLANQSPEIWNEFVKCLDLYNRGALNRRGLLLLVSVSPISLAESPQCLSLSLSLSLSRSL
jgi:histone deacetylase complex regulatory component SIN3